VPRPLLDRETVVRAVAAIAERGYAELPGLLPDSLLDEIHATVEPGLNTPTINGRYGYVAHKSQRFLAHPLTWSRAIVDVYTDPSLVEIADGYVGDEVHLTNYRIYRALPSTTRQGRWHVDNKVDTYDPVTNRFLTTVIPEDKGIILIAYLSDVEDGGFQVVAGSHLWSHRHGRENWDDEEDGFRDHIVTFNERPRGTGIVYDTRAVHRAKPYSAGKVRTSLFGQYSSSKMPGGEPVILNARDLVDLSPLQMRVLAFGLEPKMHAYPVGEPQAILEDLGLV
jgi:hypothetical protein